ncbi:MAG: glycosyltransferase [Bacteroidota bacterium]
MDLETMMGSLGVGEWILLALFISSFIVQSTRYLSVYLRLPMYKPPNKKDGGKGVSVLICARNEADNLEQFLPAVLTQEFPEFEVVVVNDCSTDHTEEVLVRLTARYKQLRFTTIQTDASFRRGKKLALAVGLKSANYEHVLLTDADCYPASSHWLKNMVSHLDKEKEIVLGYGRYEKRKGMLNALIRYETVFTAIHYLSYALKGKPYMGIGRNLGYKKALFFSKRGFSNHYHIASGDDDLFVNQHANRKNTAIEIEAESHTVSTPETTLSSWIRQKQRHLTAGSYYNSWSRLRIGTEMASRLLLYATFITLCFNPVWRWVVLILFGIFQVIRTTVFNLGMRRLNEKQLLLPSFLFDPVLPLLLGLIWFTNIFTTKHQSWR